MTLRIELAGEAEDVVEAAALVATLQRLLEDSFSEALEIEAVNLAAVESQETASRLEDLLWRHHRN